eukprot:CCRYP_000571-RA/>CCRYP_000571-RA protein AED:0.37 eAED:0.62 QI:0/-1/0/1/-1/0/1/0/105
MLMTGYSLVVMTTHYHSSSRGFVTLVLTLKTKVIQLTMLESTSRKRADGNYKFTQRALIDAIIDDINIGDSYTKPVPAKVTLQLHAIRDSPKSKGTSTTAQPWAS